MRHEVSAAAAIEAEVTALLQLALQAAPLVVACGACGSTWARGDKRCPKADLQVRSYSPIGWARCSGRTCGRARPCGIGPHGQVGL